MAPPNLDQTEYPMEFLKQKQRGRNPGRAAIRPRRPASGIAGKPPSPGPDCKMIPRARAARGLLTDPVAAGNLLGPGDKPTFPLKLGRPFNSGYNSAKQ